MLRASSELHDRCAQLQFMEREERRAPRPGGWHKRFLAFRPVIAVKGLQAEGAGRAAAALPLCGGTQVECPAVECDGRDVPCPLRVRPAREVARRADSFNRAAELLHPATDANILPGECLVEPNIVAHPSAGNLGTPRDHAFADRRTSVAVAIQSFGFAAPTADGCNEIRARQAQFAGCSSVYPPAGARASRMRCSDTEGREGGAMSPWDADPGGAETAGTGWGAVAR